MPSFRTSLLSIVIVSAAFLLGGCRHDPEQNQAHPAAAPASSARLVDVAASSGITYRWQLAGSTPRTILQTIGNGCAFLDFNNDGNLDILLVGPKLALYQGDGHGHFTDVTHQTGLDKLHGNFLGCAVGDYDNDGYDDIYLTAYRGGALLHNEGGKGFKDVTKEAGIAPQPWGSSAAFADIDGDGKLDLYIGDYVQFGPNDGPELCLAPTGEKTACHPYFYKPLKGVLYHNLGGGRFQDVTSSWGGSVVHGNTLGVAFADDQGVGHPDLALANDELPGDLLRYRNGKLSDIATAAGVAYNRDGSTHAGMGIDWGDYDNDGKLDLAITTFEVETKPIYRQESGGLFNDQATSLGITQAALPYLSFGVKWFDYDNDGWLDLIIANGHIADNIADYMPDHSFRQPTLLFHNEHGAHFTDVSHTSGADLTRPIVGRGLAVGDFDNDGRVDVLVVDSGGAPLLLHNETPQTGHWLLLNLVGTKSNRDGIGAIITADIAGRHITRFCHTDGSFFSASDKRVHLGLGSANTIDTLTVHWPSGRTDLYKSIPADHIATAVEGSATLQVK